jgi:adenine-specific DNA-methyltransferase
MSMSNKKRLELTWIGKENRLRLEPRILLANPGKAYQSQYGVTDRGLFENNLAIGNNRVLTRRCNYETNREANDLCI